MATVSPPTYTAQRFARFMRAEMAARLRAAQADKATFTANQVCARVSVAHFPADWALWAVALLCTRPEFLHHAAAQGISADYLETRGTALAFLADSASLAPVVPLATGESEHESLSVGDLFDIVDGGLDLVDLAGGLFEILGGLG